MPIPFADVIPGTTSTIHAYVHFFFMPISTVVYGVGHWALVLVAVERSDATNKLSNPSLDTKYGN